MNLSFQSRRVWVVLAAAGMLGVQGCSQKPAQKAQASSQLAPEEVLNSALPTTPAASAPIEAEVPLEAQGGTFVVPATINDTLELKFTIDSGAADVSIPADVASTLVRAGTITKDDFIGQQTFVLADGSTVPSAEFRIRTLKVGNLVLHDVTASLTNAQGELLLGQSFLKRLTSWSIDNDRHVLLLKAASPDSPAPVLTPANDAPSAPAPSPPVAADASARSLELARAYLAAWSSPSDPDGGAIRRFYASSVMYYGKPTGLDALMAEKHTFAERWPTRSYAPRDGTMAVSCADAICTVTGVVDWRDENAAAGRLSTGAASFRMTIVGRQIIGESGAVLSRTRTDQH
jgi:clan AA aspartic protease (TIGR02281 family)